MFRYTLFFICSICLMNLSLIILLYIILLNITITILELRRVLLILNYLLLIILILTLILIFLTICRILLGLWRLIKNNIFLAYNLGCLLTWSLGKISIFRILINISMPYTVIKTTIIKNLMLLLIWIWIHYLRLITCSETFLWAVCFTSIILLILFKQIKNFRSHIIFIIQLFIICLSFKSTSNSWSLSDLRCNALLIAVVLYFIFNRCVPFIRLISWCLGILFALTFTQLIL
jgi:hypothetical protein